MSDTLRWTTADLAALPDNGNRYEIIEGELYMSRQPSWHHQFACASLIHALFDWSLQSGIGHVNSTPGVVFDDDDNVVPDVVWISHARLATGLDPAGHLTVAPELVIEVLSPGLANAERDGEVKRKLYSRRGVQEYWLVDWQRQQVTVYRREQAALVLQATLFADDTLASPLLPGFACAVRRLFAGPPRHAGEETP